MNEFSEQIVKIVRSKLFVKLLMEFMPLGLFLITVDIYNIYVGSAVLAVATLVSMALVWMLYRRLALMAIITGLTGIVAATATVLLVDPMWVKLKPTIVSLVFAAILATGLAMDRPLLRPLIGEDLNLTDQGWRVVTRRWMIYFFFVAILNEAVWRGTMHLYPGPNPHISTPQADQVWATFKVVFLMPFTVIYAAFMLPLLSRYRDDHTKPMGGGDVFTKPSGSDIDSNSSGMARMAPVTARSPRRT